MTIKVLQKKLEKDFKKAFPNINLTDSYSFLDNMDPFFNNQIYIHNNKFHCYSAGWRKSEASDFVTSDYFELLWHVVKPYVILEASMRAGKQKIMSYEESFNEEAISIMRNISEDFAEKIKQEILNKKI